jgi:ketosteroid isomerase-like protein
MTNKNIARRYYQYFNERRFDEAGEFVHPEAVFTYVPTRQRLIGRAGYRALAAAWIIAFDDAQMELVTLEQLDDHTIRVRSIGHGTHTGDLILGESFVVPATGTQSHLEFTDTLTFRNGWIVDARLEFDAEELRRRLTGAQVPAASTVQN